MEVIKTIKTNARDFAIGGGIIALTAIAGGGLRDIAIANDGWRWLLELGATLNGAATFAGANLFAWIFVAVAWPTLNKFSNDSFKEGWESLSVKEKFFAFVGVSCVEIIAATLAFSSVSYRA